ncbi:uncharacterized protein LOC131316613 isoform X2 [Rhododendron vialii]|uniref:uncharacterized protein LOC131316613 isoform X2 n=1 Tax=Rhododendron vialii TaxID=182163 RepID=UPI00265E55F5|nr:uncharacterized protein LOC131316613 isoform X2 [Rhododendron vialii]
MRSTRTLGLLKPLITLLPQNLRIRMNTTTAMSASRIFSKFSKSFSLKSLNGKSAASLPKPLNQSKRISAISRLPVEVRCLVSMMPLHSAIASARLRSILSAESQSWGLIPQGISSPL